MGSLYVSDGQLLDAISDDDVIIDYAKEVYQGELTELNKHQKKLMCSVLRAHADNKRDCGSLGEAVEVEEIVDIIEC